MSRAQMIRLTPLAPIHAAALQPLLEDPAIAATTPFPHPYPPDGATAYVEESIALRKAGTKYVYAICEPQGLPVGMALLKDVDRQKGEAELGYWIGRPYWGRGYATEAAAAMTAYGFETLGLQTILAVTLVANPSSLRVLEKLGFVELSRSTWALPKWTAPKPCVTLRVSVDTWRAPDGVSRPMAPILNRLVVLLALSLAAIPTVASQSPQPDLQPPGRLVDLGGYRMHIWCTGKVQPNHATVVLSAGGGDVATDWSLVQLPLSDSVRVCSYDRPGYGWSDPGPYPRTIRQETFEVHAALQKSGESTPSLMVGHSIGAFVARLFAETYRNEVVGVVLVGPTNENGKLGYRGQFVLPRLLATDRPVPDVASFADSPPHRLPGAEADSCRAQAERSARIVRPYDQLRAQAQRYRVWALSHPVCVEGQDDYFAEEMAGFFAKWSAKSHSLGDLPLIVVMGTRGSSVRPPYLSEADWRSDSIRIDLSRLSRRGRLVKDSLSGHHVQLDNPTLVVTTIRELLRQVPR